MKKYWFAPKTYGYGYVPISAEGWVAIFILIGIGLIIAYLNNLFNPINMTLQRGLLFALEIIILGFVFLKLFEKKCKGKLKWNFEAKK